MDSPSDNDNTPEPTHFLLKGWHEGEQGALHELIARDLDWMQNQVRLRVYGILGAKGEADDYVHDVMVKVLQYRPPSEMSDRDEFRALMKRIIENTLCNHAAALKRGKRDSRRERPIVSDSLLYLARIIHEPTLHHARIAIWTSSDVSKGDAGLRPAPSECSTGKTPSALSSVVFLARDRF